MAGNQKTRVSQLSSLTMPNPDRAERWGWTARRRRVLLNACGHLLLIGLTVIFLIPLLWMVSTALKERGQTWLWPPQWIPRPIVWGNFSQVFELAPFGRFFANTMVLVFWNVLGTVLSCTIVAYGFARLNFPGRRLLFMLLLSTLMLPGHVTMIPTFILFKTLGWYNTFLPLTVPAFTGSAFYIFLMRQYLMTIPMDLDDAARIDGCNYLQVFYRILLPLCVPPLTIMVVFTFLATWNDFFGPLIYLSDQSRYPIALGLALFQGLIAGSTNWNLLMAASLMSTIPPLVVYYFAQDKLIGGIASVGLKG